MKIAQLLLKAYGALSDKRLQFPGEAGLHLIYGPNEAGKSTTLRAVRGLLFGIPERGERFLHQQLRVGATLVDAAGHRLSLMRRNARKQSLFAMEEESGTELTDQPLPEESLARLLGGLDEGLYRSLFGLDLEELTRGGEALLAGQGEVGASLFEAAAGLAGLRQLSKALEEQASQLFRPRASTSAIHVAVKELENWRRAARDAAVKPQLWEQSERALREAEAQHAAVREQLTALRAEQARLARLSGNLPLAAERLAREQQLADLTEVPLLPPEAAHQRLEAEERLRAAREAAARAEARLAELTARLQGLTVREPLLHHAPTIERLRHAGAAWRSAVERLPGIRAAQADLTARLGRRLATLGQPPPAGELTALRALLPPATLGARITALAEEYAEQQAREEALARRAGTLAATLTRLRDELAAHPQHGPLEGLDALRGEAQRLADRLERLEQEIATLAPQLTRSAAALGRGSPAEVAALPVPLPATLREFAEGYRRLDEEALLIASREAELERDLADRRRELRGLTAAGEIATHAQVVAARRHRDEGWQRVRAAFIEGSGEAAALAAGFDPQQPLPEAFEGAVREADRLIDLLHADAGRATHYQITTGRIADMEAALADLGRQRGALAGERRDLEAGWARVCEAIDRPGITPAAALEWSQRHSAFLERHTQLEGLQREREAVAAALARVAAELERELARCALPAGDPAEPLATRLARLARTLEAARQAATERAALAGRLAQQEQEQAETEADRSALAAARARWEGRWAEALTALRLPPGALPAEARARLAELAELSALLDQLEQAGSERRAEEARVAAFEADYAALCAAIDEPPEPAADQALVRLHAALLEAREAEQQRRQQAAEQASEQERLTQAALAEAAQRARLDELVARAGCAGLEALPAVEQAAERKRQLLARLAEIDEQLVRSAARPLPEVLAELADTDPQAAAARLAELEQAINEGESRLEQAWEQLTGCRATFAAIDGGERAAAAQQEAEAVAARIARHARSYARARLAQAVVARVVQSYRERHQGPVLRRAAEIFRTITLERFRDLVTDYDEESQLLLGERPDGSRLTVAGMSQGTRDQLFLALRLAAIEEHLKAREPIPLIIDDLLVQFDDPRAGATLGVLADLAQRTQVLFFTHHRHLLELAEAQLPAGRWVRHEL